MFMCYAQEKSIQIEKDQKKKKKKSTSLPPPMLQQYMFNRRATGSQLQSQHLPDCQSPPLSEECFSFGFALCLLSGIAIFLLPSSLQKGVNLCPGKTTLLQLQSNASRSATMKQQSRINRLVFKSPLIHGPSHLGACVTVLKVGCQPPLQLLPIAG